ncbi:hypothetical protein A9Q99_22410 [Gammaproteobacteria bacterium 45_16_T64]|nr:hypothetical protein A9Q99_22410 [Gammaproteobacteria bacterium 45_16_T64]
MKKLLFRSCEATDGRKFAFLTDQPEVEDCFDNGYKVAYKDNSNDSELLAEWNTQFTVKSQEFSLLPSTNEIQSEIMQGFTNMIENLIKGIDVFFCDYNLGIEGDLPMCNGIMEQYKSTDFVLFSCADIVGSDPTVQPYMVSYCSPRYETGAKIAQQHRIYCKTDHFAFCQATNAIVLQRKKDGLMGGHIRGDLEGYIKEPCVDIGTATTAINRFVEVLQRFNGDIKALASPNETTAKI